MKFKTQHKKFTVKDTNSLTSYFIHRDGKQIWVTTGSAKTARIWDKTYTTVAAAKYMMNHPTKSKP